MHLSPRRPANRGSRYGTGRPDCRSPSLVAWAAWQRSNPRPSVGVVGPDPELEVRDRRPCGSVSEFVPTGSPRVQRREPSPGIVALGRPLALVGPQPFNLRPGDSPPVAAGDVFPRGVSARRARGGRGRGQWVSDEGLLRRPFTIAWLSVSLPLRIALGRPVSPLYRTGTDVSGPGQQPNAGEVPAFYKLSNNVLSPLLMRGLEMAMGLASKVIVNFVSFSFLGLCDGNSFDV